MIETPHKPFSTYKWKWLSYAPTEGLLDAPVFLGALRAFARHEHARTSDKELLRELAKVQADTQTRVDLARDDKRNLIRNSGQYWKGTGLLKPTRGVIELTSLGRSVADGAVTQAEFAAIMVQQTILPNPMTLNPEEYAKWREAGLEIKPLALILEVLGDLGRDFGGRNAAHISVFELVRICIPLAGAMAGSKTIAEAIALHREGKLDVSKWPDCIPGDNDERMAREFLLFLSNFGFCRFVQGGRTKQDEVYQLDELIDSGDMVTPHVKSLFDDPANTNEVIETIRQSMLPSIIERQRTSTTVLARPGQSRFRDIVFKAYAQKCFLSGDSLGEILEAAHIIPVANGGADTAENGICLRVDIHRLFDSNNIRIKRSGALYFSGALLASANYHFLPKMIELPNFVNRANIEWRDNYF